MLKFYGDIALFGFIKIAYQAITQFMKQNKLP